MMDWGYQFELKLLMIEIKGKILLIEVRQSSALPLSGKKKGVAS
jgi:hypothetical protein